MSRLGGRFVVVGDAMVDVYLDGVAKGLAREAPVPVVRVERDAIAPGGAANAAMNLAALGAHVTFIAAFGDDAWGARLATILKTAGVATTPIVVPGRVTTQKVRVRVDDGHLNPPRIAFRYDVESNSPIDPHIVTAAIERASCDADAILVSDSGLGVVTDPVINHLNAEAIAGRAIIVDSRYQTLRFHAVAALTPSDEEAAAALQRPLETESDAMLGLADIIAATNADTALITRGARGVAVWSNEAPVLLPAVAREAAVDTTGAGDSAAAAFAIALVAGASPLDAARFANHAGALAVRRAGTVAVSRADLLASYTDETTSSRTVA